MRFPLNLNDDQKVGGLHSSGAAQKNPHWLLHSERYQQKVIVSGAEQPSPREGNGESVQGSSLCISSILLWSAQWRDRDMAMSTKLTLSIPSIPCSSPLCFIESSRMGALSGAIAPQRVLPTPPFMALPDLQQPGIAAAWRKMPSLQK